MRGALTSTASRSTLRRHGGRSPGSVRAPLLGAALHIERVRGLLALLAAAQLPSCLLPRAELDRRCLEPDSDCSSMNVRAQEPASLGMGSMMNSMTPIAESSVDVGISDGRRAGRSETSAPPLGIAPLAPDAGRGSGSAPTEAAVPQAVSLPLFPRRPLRCRDLCVSWPTPPWMGAR